MTGNMRLSRRGFIKGVAKVLPILLLHVIPINRVFASHVSSCNDSCKVSCKSSCNNSCVGTHKVGCSTCSTQCRASCSGICIGSCRNTGKCSECSDACKGSCHGNCSGSCESLLKGKDAVFKR